MRRASVAFVLVLAFFWMAAPAALAHTAFESSDPADGATLDEPINRIRIVFSGEAQPADDGFVVFDPSGELRTPDRVTSRDNLTWVLHFDDPIEGGIAGVRWMVAAPDAHPIEGSFSFTVPDGGAADAPNSAVVRPPSARTLPPVAEGTNLDDFLDTAAPAAPLLALVGAISRSLALLGAMVAIGGIIFAAVVLRGSERDIRSVLFWVRRAAVLLGIGSIGELAHQLAVVNGNWITIWPLTSWGTALWSSLGVAILLRLIGSGLMLRAHLAVVPAHTKADPVLSLQGAVPIGAGPAPPDGGVPALPYQYDDDMAWRVDGDLALVFAGVATTLAAFAFDGHTVSEGLRPLTSLVAIAHTGAGAVWAGGLVMLVHVVWLRHRRGSDSRALQLAVRFSVVAATSLAIAGAAGTVLAFTILDGPSELWSTTWGRVLLAKVGFVAVAAASGAYNHKVLIPHMMRRPPNDPSADAEFRRTATIEGAAMLLVIVMTALLVASAA